MTNKSKQTLIPLYHPWELQSLNPSKQDGSTGRFLLELGHLSRYWDGYEMHNKKRNDLQPKVLKQWLIDQVMFYFKSMQKQVF